MTSRSTSTSPTRLRIAVYASLAATLLVAAVAIYRTGLKSWIGDVIRPAGLVLFTVLSLQGKSWARWILIAWLGISVIVLFADLVAAFGQPGVVALLLIMAALYVWTILELVSAETSASRSRQRTGGSDAAA